MRRVAIVGSRKYRDMDAVHRFVYSLPPEAIVITGGAAGVDAVAQAAADERGMVVIVHWADWKAHGKAAGPIRNSTIAAACTELVAFWDGKSRGTADVVRKAKARAGVTVTVWTVAV